MRFTLLITMSLLYTAAVYSQDIISDRTAVQAILDSNGLFTVPFTDVSVIDSVSMRIVQLNLTSQLISIIPPIIGNLTALNSGGRFK